MPGRTTRKFLLAGVCLSALLLAVLLRPSAATQGDEKLPAAKPVAGPRFVVDPYLQYATRTSTTVMCETDSPTTCVVEYGATFPPDQKAESPSGTLHEIKLENLLPKTKYFYRVTCAAADGTTVVGKPLTFFTAVDAGDAFTFTVIGDTQKNPTITGKIAKLMWDRRPHFILHLGDVVDNGPDPKEWTEELFRPCAELFGRVPVYPCIGNHEKNHANYYKYFSLPKPEYYYSFTYGNAEFFVLDTNKIITPFSEQFTWLDKALAASKAKWKICYHHHPIWSSDSDDYGDTAKTNTRFGDPRARMLIPLYEKHNVDLAMNGHIHYYERTFPIKDGKVDPKGVTYLTSGGGGGKLEGTEPTPAFFKNQGRVDYHYCYFTVFGGTMEGKVFDHENRLFDSFSLKKD